ncbi:MAG: hypothetical protein HW416_782 [Chloroflexi bacterium]|nr:hypothetical protein [Chloroflexota bacterium]
MANTLRWTIADLDLFPDNDGKRYEIIGGELYVTTQPTVGHQFTCNSIGSALHTWDRQAGLGATFPAPGVIFAEDDNVAPDLVWVSRQRLRAIVREDGHLYGAPELVVEVLSPGSKNQQRDREIKLRLYSRRGVHEYWIVDWEQRQIEVHRHVEGALMLIATFLEQDTLTSPLLPGFSSQVGDLLGRLPVT